MIKMEEWMNIHALHKQGLSFAEIGRLTGRDWRTVKQALFRDGAPKYERAPRGSKLDGYTAYLDQALSRGTLRASRLYREVKAQGYEGGYELVKRYVREQKRSRNRQAVMRFETLPGQQAQVDWGEERIIWSDGSSGKVYSFTMILGYSRLRYVTYTTRMDLYTLMACHIAAFEFFCGVPREILYDNMKTVVKDRSGSDVTYQETFLFFAAHYGFMPRACWPYRPQTKGKTERLVGFVHDDFFAGTTFVDMADLNRRAQSWLTRVNHCDHGTTGVAPVKRHQQERPHLLPLPQIAYDPSPVETRLVSRDCLISFNANRYSVPHAHVGKRVTVRYDDSLIRIYDDTELIATHPLLMGKGRMRIDGRHYHGLMTTEHKKTAQNAAPDQKTTALLVAHPALKIAVDKRPLSVYEALLDKEVCHE